MDVYDTLKRSLGEQFGLEELAPNIMRLYAPFFHEDGDMYSIYIDASHDDIFIRDYGNTLMRVSYTFNIDTDNKRNILSSIVRSNSAELDDGELILKANSDNLFHSLLRYTQLVSKVSNIDILSREIVRSMFYDYLKEFVMEHFSQYGIRENMHPVADDQLMVDYTISAARPLYLFGVNENTKASRVVISCLTFQKKQLPFRSIIVHEDFWGLTKFYQKQITNAADKQFTSLDDFKTEGPAYIAREIA